MAFFIEKVDQRVVQFGPGAVQVEFVVCVEAKVSVLIFFDFKIKIGFAVRRVDISFPDNPVFLSEI